MTTREVLIAARALIDTPEKWWRGESGAKGYCAGNAIFDAGGGDVDVYQPAGALLARTVGAGKGHTDLFAWNDAPERTHAEVLDGFDRAIEATA